MSIECESYKKYALICDKEVYFDDFNAAVKYKKAKGWESVREDMGKGLEDWYDVCPDCKGEE